MTCYTTPPVPASAGLSRDEGLRLLGTVGLGRIVFISRARPAIRLVAHTMDGDHLLVGVRHEPEIASALSSSGLSLVVYEADAVDPATRQGWSVVASGRAGLVEDEDELAAALERLRPWPGERVDLVLRIRPELISGFHTGG
ncbi:pyridoxamine 5'-phosphate oxidase family protein [Nonomuraea pusilla]|uniref:Nitroimidazol reductase NimA, pyridoxamine 5'-phosphate oxidase superfamily n=1 Tax=Nonomuraea pusilla TaxID=46177 RepID=A0A1H7TRX5_9ACTN|nr:pyridoxamine 5'-phosphate oxidase family protein [Nonomuraea pusilla]SEL87166.1 Nitroimidazol reductase NimA, pyridoxamine 5'-phosphate oxidase superfamily [Nonomuraea pusilla]